MQKNQNHLQAILQYALAPTILNHSHHMIPFYIFVVQILRFAQNSDLMEHYFDWASELGLGISNGTFKQHCRKLKPISSVKYVHLQ